MTRPISVFLLAALGVFSFAQSPDPKDAWAAIERIRSDAAERAKKGESIDRAETERLAAAKAREEIAKTDLAKVDAKDADGWAQLCEYAGMYAESEALAQKSIRYHAITAFQTQSTLLHAYLEQGKTDEFLDSLRYVMATDSTMIGQLGDSVRYFGAKYAKTNPKLLLSAYDALLSRIDLSRPPANDVDRHFRDYVYVDLAAKKLELIADLGRRQEAITGLKALRTRFANSKATNAFGQSPAYRIDEVLGRWEMISKASPTITYDRAIGDFKGLAALKGKVVLVDFFAHWCGPCKASFPELRETYAKYRAQGFEVVGVTSYYGYIGQRQGLKPADEYEAMKTFVKEQGMTWPVAFDPKQASFKAFQVGPIPHAVLIDRKGNVRRVLVGYEPTRTPDTRLLIEKLLAE